MPQSALLNFVGFLCASVISRAKNLDSLNYRLVIYALFIFIAAVLKLSITLEPGSSATLTDLLFRESSFIMSGFAAWSTMHALDDAHDQEKKDIWDDVSRWWRFAFDIQSFRKSVQVAVAHPLSFEIFAYSVVVKS